MFPHPQSVSLLHFMEMVFSHPQGPFPSELALKLISHFTDQQIDTVLKALRQDKSERIKTETQNEVWNIVHRPILILLLFLFRFFFSGG